MTGHPEIPERRLLTIHVEGRDVTHLVAGAVETRTIDGVPVAVARYTTDREQSTSDHPPTPPQNESGR